MRELPSRHPITQKLAQRIPSIPNLELQQVLLRHHSAHRIVVAQVDLLALAHKVALEEAFEEFLQHGVVEACAPAEILQPAKFPVTDAPEDSLHGGGVPGVDVAVREHDFGFGVGGYELGGKGDSGPVAYWTQRMISDEALKREIQDDGWRWVLYLLGSDRGAYPSLLV
jgi:hypothetical protein